VGPTMVKPMQYFTRKDFIKGFRMKAALICPLDRAFAYSSNEDIFLTFPSLFTKY